MTVGDPSETESGERRMLSRIAGIPVDQPGSHEFGIDGGAGSAKNRQRRTAEVDADCQNACKSYAAAEFASADTAGSPDDRGFAAVAENWAGSCRS